MKKIAIIPAKGFSKRIHKKNMVDFLGKPMIDYTIIAAQESKMFDEIIVTTDSEQIKRYAEAKGCYGVIARQEGVATCAHDIISCTRWLDAEFACVLLITSPLRNANHIVQSYDSLCSYSADYVTSVCESWDRPGGYIQVKNGRCHDVLNRTSVWETLFTDNGAINWLNIKKFISDRKEYSDHGIQVTIPIDGKAAPYFMSKIESIDVNTAEDLEMAKIIAESLWKNELKYA